MIYGYARVSTTGQATEGNGLEAQEQIIRSKYADITMYREAYTGKTTERPIFQELLSRMVEGDMLVVAKLDRLARNTQEGLEVVQDLFARGCSIHVLNVGLLEDTPMGRFFITTMLAVAELERNQILERTREGLEIARQKEGFKCGKPPLQYDKEKAKELYTLTLQDKITQTEAYTQLGVSRSSWLKIRKELSS